MDDLGPGKRLRDILIEMYPFSEKGTQLINKMDFEFAFDGQMAFYAYQSSINYLVRRLITLAVYLYKSTNNSNEGSRKAIENYLISYTRLNETQAGKISKILYDCIVTANRPKHDGKSVIETARRRDFCCFTCGTTLEFEDKESWSYATADHLWPKSMGGYGDANNLRAVCKSCNNTFKANYIDASDFHYEEMSLTCVDYDEYKEKRERQYELAILAKTEYCCAVCGKPAHVIGELKIGRINPKDSWHFHNLY